MNRYVSKAMEVLKREGTERVGNILKVGGLIAGGVAGGVAFANTGDAVSATHAMTPGALAYLTGEGLCVARDYAIGGIKNGLQYVGRAARVAAPIVMSIALGDNTYNPAFDLGPVILGGTGMYTSYAGDKKQERKDGYIIIQKEGAEAALQKIRLLPGKDFASVVGRAAKIKK